MDQTYIANAIAAARGGVDLASASIPSSSSSSSSSSASVSSSSSGKNAFNAPVLSQEVGEE